MSQRRLFYNTLEEEFTENMRIRKRKIRLQAKKMANMGSSCFKTTDRGKDWLTKTHTKIDGPNACRYTPKLDSVKPVAPAYSGYKTNSHQLRKQMSATSARNSWLAGDNYQFASTTAKPSLDFEHRKILRDNLLNRRQGSSLNVYQCPPIFTGTSTTTTAQTP